MEQSYRNQAQLLCKHGHDKRQRSQRFIKTNIEQYATNIRKNCTKRFQTMTYEGLLTDLLESKVNWALGNSANQRATRVGEMPQELFKILQDGTVESTTSRW